VRERRGCTQDRRKVEKRRVCRHPNNVLDQLQTRLSVLAYCVPRIAPYVHVDASLRHLSLAVFTSMLGRLHCTAACTAIQPGGARSSRDQETKKNAEAPSDQRTKKVSYFFGSPRDKSFNESFTDIDTCLFFK
jgi:hypothetical protein